MPDENLASQYAKTLERYSRELGEELGRDLYRDFDAPSSLWGLQNRVIKYINDPKFARVIKDPKTSPLIRELLKSQVTSLKELCKRARTAVDKVPDGDAWLERWK